MTERCPSCGRPLASVVDLCGPCEGRLVPTDAQRDAFDRPSHMAAYLEGMGYGLVRSGCHLHDIRRPTDLVGLRVEEVLVWPRDRNLRRDIQWRLWAHNRPQPL